MSEASPHAADPKAGRSALFSAAFRQSRNPMVLIGEDHTQHQHSPAAPPEFCSVARAAASGMLPLSLLTGLVAGPIVRSTTYGGPMPKKYRDVRRALEEAGWSVIRQRGSHEVWAHPDRQERIVVAGKDGATVPPGTLGSIRRASGLEHLR